MKFVGRHAFQDSSVSARIASILEKQGMDHEFADAEIEEIIAAYKPTAEQVKALIDWVRDVIRNGRRPTTIH